MQKVGKNSEKGIALIAAVMAVAVLLAIGLSFAFNMRLEEKAAVNNLYSVQAKYLAEAGMKYSVDGLGEDFTTGTYQKRNFDTLADDWKAADWVTNTQIKIGAGGYQLSIVDEASKIYINDTNPNLATLLEGLGAVIASTPIDSSEGTDIVNYRDNTLSGEFIVTEEIQKVPNLIDAGESYNDFKDYITATAYVDTSVNRAPINVNTAGQYVLQAVIGGVTGITDTQRNKIVLAILEYRSGVRYNITDDPWSQTGTAVGAGNANPFDGIDSNRTDGIDPIISGFDSDNNLDNDGDLDSADDAEDTYLFAGGARGEFEELIYSLAGGTYGSDQYSVPISDDLADDICDNANPDPDAVYTANGGNPGADSWTTDFSFKSRNFEITSTGRVLADSSDWNSEKYAESKIKVIIQRSQ